MRTGGRRPPRGFARDDFRVPSLDEVLRAFPRTPMNIESTGSWPPGRRGWIACCGRSRSAGRRDGLDPCGTTPAVETVTASRGRLDLRMKRQGLSLEKRTGTVRLVGTTGSGRDGRTLGGGTYSLDGGASSTDAAMRLNAAGRAAVRGRKPMAMRAIVSERGRVVWDREIGVR